MRNKLFQMAWRWLRPKRRGHSLDDDFDWMTRQFQIAEWFGGAELVGFGDSNWATKQAYERVRRFKRVTVGLGRGGMTFFEWALFFAGPKGAAIRQRIGSTNVIINLGGNHALQNRMGGWRESAKIISRMFPQSWIINVPPVLPEILERVHPDAPANVLQINAELAKLWPGRVIDVYRLLNGNSTAYTLLSDDTIHYGERADAMLIDLINKIPWGQT